MTVSALWFILSVPMVGLQRVIVIFPEHTHSHRGILSSGLEIIKLEFILKLKTKRNDWPIIELF